VSALLIPEPPLQVLRSLACQVGINEAIIVQQVYYRGRLTEGSWVERSAEDWAREFPWMGARTIERAVSKLREVGWLEKRGTRDWRVPPNRQPGGEDRQIGGENRQIGGSPRVKGEENLKREKKGASKSRILSPAEEPEGFAQWLGQHVSTAKDVGVVMTVPRAGTSRRSTLARTFKRLVEEGHELEEFRLASLGVFSSQFMREGGYVSPENVLRVEKFGRWVDEGRRAEAVAAAAPADAVDWSQFDD
jgi:hypothetical protein